MDVLLQNFYEDVHMRETVKAAIVEKLKEDATSAVFKKQSTAGLYEANKAVNEFFEMLEDKYGKKKESKKEPEGSR